MKELLWLQLQQFETAIFKMLKYLDTHMKYTKPNLIWFEVFICPQGPAVVKD